MRSNRLTLMVTTLAAVLLGACSQAADMPTAVAMPDVLASASADNNRPVIEGPTPLGQGVAFCGEFLAFQVDNLTMRVVRRGMNRHPLGNTEQQNAFLFSEGVLQEPWATENGNKIWADVRKETEGTVIEGGEKLAFSLVEAYRWNGDLVKVRVPNGITGVEEDANLPATITESTDLKVNGKKTNYFKYLTIVRRLNVETLEYEEFSSKTTTNCR